MPARTSPARPRGGATRATARSRRAAARRRSAGSPLAPVGRALSGSWLLLARGAGGAARAVGRQAATARLDPAHRRDGVGLAVVAVAIVTGVGLWSAGGGPVGRGVHDLLR
ncbi:MAG TPA: cell division protein FtsK, partial [Mycobacteriales bacterium]|nr:cell division protein FtsK [Mycobacteriales bacterium]